MGKKACFSTGLRGQTLGLRVGRFNPTTGMDYHSLFIWENLEKYCELAKTSARRDLVPMDLLNANVHIIFVHLTIIYRTNNGYTPLQRIPA
jgi:hypothetical protein